MSSSEDLNQYFTAQDLADRIAAWALRDWTFSERKHLRVLEPSAGNGALVRGMLRAGIDVDNLVAVEIDPLMCGALREISGLRVVNGDFTQADLRKELGRFDLGVMNPPYNNCRAAVHLQHAVAMSGETVALCLASVEFGTGRAETLWTKAMPKGRVILARRPVFEGPSDKGQTARYDYHVLRLVAGACEKDWNCLTERWSE